MHPELERLVDVMQEASALLLNHGERSWAEWLRKDAERIGRLDFYDVEHALAAFGGMGSINDLVLCPTNGHNIQESEVAKVNEKLQNLLRAIHGLATKLAREEGNASKGT